MPEQTLTPEAIAELDLLRIATTIRDMDQAQLQAEHDRVQDFLKRHDDGGTWLHIISVRVIADHLGDLAKGKGSRRSALRAVQEAAGSFMRRGDG